ncbi:Isotrichodermin C-15 hydroxylase [Escovopsis weberi]|uniref:Isotrichodermin C-15 hydroxylase n=1 Tax=Escovopsis weberi TaxID=150374 RepID=A0A0M8MXR9_ESCWE|nr:Isotrichodermin C-15 hydroxylase [Escovopsis weberi]
MAAAWCPAPSGNLWAVALLGLLAYRLVRLVSDVFRSSLAAVPGPRARAASRLPLAWSIVRGTLVQDAQALHRRYGPVVRISPNEVSLAAEESWQQVLHGPEQRFLKDPVWWGDQMGLPTSIVTAIDPQRHKRLRRAVAPSFAPEAIKGQEPAFQKYVDLLIDRLRSAVRKSGPGKGKNNGKDGENESTGTAVVDIVPWLNFTTFDIFGALFFSHSFDCLQRSEYHPWIALLFGTVKLAAFIAAARLFPVGQFLLLRCIPPALRRVQADHYGHIVDRVSRRLALKDGGASDLMSHILSRGDRADVPEDDFNATMLIMTIAGSETVATTLSGTIHYLANSPDKFATLAREVRARFDTIEGITVDAVNGLPYLEAVIKEGLRLCPAIPFTLPRRVPEEGEVGYAIHRRPDYFHEAASFIPDRWLCEQPGSGEGNPKAEQARSPFAADHLGAVQAFSVGPRHCPGRGFAWVEMRLIVAKLVWEFDLLPLEEDAATTATTTRWEDAGIRLRERTDIGGSDKRQ